MLLREWILMLLSEKGERDEEEIQYFILLRLNSAKASSMILVSKSLIPVFKTIAPQRTQELSF